MLWYEIIILIVFGVLWLYTKCLDQDDEILSNQKQKDIIKEKNKDIIKEKDNKDIII